MENRKKWPLPHIDKKKAWGYAKNIFLVTLGCALLAFGDAVFFTPFEIVSGGAVSFGIIIAHFAGDNVLINDIVVAVFQVGFFFLGLFTLGKKFSAHTLLATIAYPLFYTLFFRFGIGQGITASLMAIRPEEPTVVLLLAGIFGAVFGGTGCALTFLGDGSTGGFDILTFLISKYTNIKEGVSSFAIDAVTILLGLLVFQDYVGIMVGIISAFVAALLIQYIYVQGNSCLIVDIISIKYEEIADYIHDSMDHATTLVDTVGGYTGENRRMIRVIIYRREQKELTDFIASVDPRAFVSFITAKAINGKGFEPFKAILGRKVAAPVSKTHKPRKKKANSKKKTAKTPQKKKTTAKKAVKPKINEVTPQTLAKEEEKANG